ncbi:MAG: IS4 family transposase [Nitrospiraceae bacterium]|nr:MAG: IS4 family transposase [Nitrospiraceae bacterium]RPH78047.1 MAG: IS4 family transposase [Nitrospiraceae bacterium]
MLASWVVEEMKDADLHDKRLNRRLEKILSDLGNRPTASIPAACGGRKEMVAAYRFFDNESASPAEILQSHYARTIERMAEQKVALLVQDTTELDFTRPKQQVEGAGPMDGADRLGAFLHPLEAFTPDGTPLGAVWEKMWTRDAAIEMNETASEKRERRRLTPIEEKESGRWLEGLQQARTVAQQVPNTQCVCMADSEADIFELFSEPRGERPVEWLIRSCHNRTLQAPDDAEDETSRYILDAVAKTPVLFTKELDVRGREPKIKCKTSNRHQPRKSRTAEVEVRATTVTLRPPPRPDRKLLEVTVNIVWVRELNPPEGDYPVEWLLVTTLPIDTVQEVQTILQYYTVRFMIEVLFRVLKSGCRVEERMFEHIDRLLPCVAVYLIVAWRTLMLCRMGRSCPDLDCEAVFEPSEWKSVWLTVQRKPLPQQPPRLGEMMRLVAQLGGYVNRPNRKDPPGPQTTWLGLQRMKDLAWAWDTFGPGSGTASHGDVGMVQPTCV